MSMIINIRVVIYYLVRVLVRVTCLTTLKVNYIIQLSIKILLIPIGISVINTFFIYEKLT